MQEGTDDTTTETSFFLFDEDSDPEIAVTISALRDDVDVEDLGAAVRDAHDAGGSEMPAAKLVEDKDLVREELESVADNVWNLAKQSGYAGQFTVKTGGLGINFEHYDGPLDFEVLSVWEHDGSIVFSLRITTEGDR